MSKAGFPIWADEVTHGLADTLAKTKGMTKKSVVAHAVREYADRNGMNEKHPQSSEENHGQPTGRDVKTSSTPLAGDAPLSTVGGVTEVTTARAHEEPNLETQKGLPTTGELPH